MSDFSVKPPFVDSFPQRDRSAVETCTGVRRRKPKGWKSPTGYYLDRYVVQYPQGSNQVFYTNKLSGETKKLFECNGAIGRNVTPYGGVMADRVMHEVLPRASITTGPEFDKLADLTLIKARNKMKRGDLNLGIAFAERKRTANLVTTTALQLVRSIRMVRRGNFDGAIRELNIKTPFRPKTASVPSRWLELQYGWKPLLSDVYGAVDKLTKCPSSDWRVTAKAVENRRSRFERTVDDIYCSTGVSATQFIGVQSRIDAFPDNLGLIEAASVGITNPALIAWELVPFSFVVDWALPIGAYLESLDAMLGYTDVWYVQSRMVKQEWKLSGKAGTRDNLYDRYSYTPSFSGSAESVVLSRTVGRNVPLPTMPRLRDPRGLTRMANALALLATAFGGRSASR